jgi:LacI family transcriptional regulator
VGFLAGPPVSHSGRQRSLGYRAALNSMDLPGQASWIRHCAPTVDGGQEVAHSLLSAEPALTALFCYNDLVAVGALQACAVLGRVVPEEIAIVGYDDIPLAALVTPALTTCRVPRYELGGKAVRLLLDHLRGEPETRTEVVLQPELVIRASAP